MTTKRYDEDLRSNEEKQADAEMRAKFERGELGDDFGLGVDLYQQMKEIRQTLTEEKLERDDARKRSPDASGTEIPQFKLRLEQVSLKEFDFAAWVESWLTGQMQTLRCCRDEALKFFQAHRCQRITPTSLLLDFPDVQILMAKAAQYHAMDRGKRPVRLEDIELPPGTPVFILRIVPAP